ncbi:MAG: hypothetical protein L0229_06000 [Blastocatellia bacterium]|nr:hypothetical protein [Blastocatellia bacterium]
MLNPDFRDMLSAFCEEKVEFMVNGCSNRDSSALQNQAWHQFKMVVRLFPEASIMDSITEQTTESLDEQARIQAVIRSLRTLLEDDEQEQRETFEYLKQVLEEDRPSNRRLFR